MPYSSEPIRILSGGLNLIGSSDTIGDDEAVELLNWSQDSQGALRSRKGHTNLYSVTGPITAITRGMGSLWIAAGGTAYKDGAGFIGGGSPMGIVSFQGWVWIIFPGVGRKTDGSVNYRWIPVAPTGKATVKSVPGPEATVVDFGAGFTVDPSGDELYNPTLQINAQADTAYTATKTIGADLSGGGDTGGLFKIVVWCKNWAKVDSIKFEIDLNTGDFTTDVVRAAFTNADLHGGVKEEITLYLRKYPLSTDDQVLDPNRWGAFRRIGQTQNKDYSTATKVRVGVVFNDTTKLRFESWTLVGDANSTLEGNDIVWYYTFQTDAGHESNPSPATDPLSLTRGQGEIDNMDVSGDAQVTKKNVYRGGGTLPDVLRVKNDTTTNGATSYTDGNSNDALTSLDLPLENDHGDPPPVGILAGPFFNRLIAAGNRKVFWSKLDKPYAFVGALLETGDWSGVGEEVGDLVAAVQMGDMIAFYGTAGVCELIGDPGGSASSLHTISKSFGIQTWTSVVGSPRGNFAISGGGVYNTGSGGSADLLSKKVQPGMSGGFQSGGVGWFRDVVWASDGSRTFKLDLLTGRWFEDSRLFQAFYSDSGGLLGIMQSGQVVQLEQGTADNGAGIPLIWRSKAFDAGLLSDEKRWGALDIVADTGGATLTVQAFLEEPDQVITLGTISGGKQEFRLTFNPDGEGVDARKCSIRITGTTAGAEVVIYSCNLWMYQKAREGLQFDTGEQSLGTHKMKRLLELVVDLDNQAVANLTVKSDRPEPMANRSTSLSFAATIDRRMEPMILPTGIIGRLFRTVLWGNDLRCYGGKFLVEVIGTFLEGGKSEFYFSDPLDFSSERIKLVRWIEIVYSLAPGASATVTLSTDQPGPAMAVRQTWSLAPTGNPSLSNTEQAIKLRVPSTVKGRLYALGINPTGDMAIESIRFYAKMIGEPNATAWAWIPLPVQGTQPAIWQDVSFSPDQPG